MPVQLAQATMYLEPAVPGRSSRRACYLDGPPMAAIAVAQGITKRPADHRGCRRLIQCWEQPSTGWTHALQSVNNRRWHPTLESSNSVMNSVNTPWFSNVPLAATNATHNPTRWPVSAAGIRLSNTLFAVCAAQNVGKSNAPGAPIHPLNPGAIPPCLDRRGAP